MTRLSKITAFALMLGTAALPAQQKPPATNAPPADAKQPAATQASAAPTKAQQLPLPAGYVIGPDDVLQVLFWRDRDMSAEVTVRPDGMISLPLLNDVPAAGLTPEQLRDKLNEFAKRFVEGPNATVVVRQINSRKVFITGQVARPGAFPLNTRMTVLQLISLAGGLTEFADGKHITIMRIDSDGARPSAEPVTLMFNYNEVASRRNLRQNIELKPGDTVIVP